MKRTSLLLCLLLSLAASGHAKPPARGASGALVGEEAGASADLPSEAKPRQTFTARVRARARQLRDRLSAHHAARTGVEERGERTTDPKFDKEDAEGWHTFAGVPFVEGRGDGREIHPNDPRQGALGDCYVISAMIAIARTDPGKIRRMIRDLGGGRYEVHLYDVGTFWTDSKQVVTARLPYVTDGGSRRPVYARSTDTRREGDRTLLELWPSLIEKAYAQYEGSYPGIESGYASSAMSFMTGADTDHDVIWPWTSSNWIRDRLSNALRDGHPVCVGTKDDVGDLGAEVGLVGGHAYVVWAEEDGRFRLYNPWGRRHPSRTLSASELRRLIDNVYVGNF